MPEKIAIICTSAYCAINVLEALTDKQKQQVVGFFIRPNNEFNEAFIYAKTQNIHPYGYRTEEDSEDGENGLVRTKSLLTAIRASCIVGVGLSETALRKVAPNENIKLYLISAPDLNDIEAQRKTQSILVSAWRLEERWKTQIGQSTVRVSKDEPMETAVGYIRNAIKERMSCLMEELENLDTGTPNAVKPAPQKETRKRNRGWIIPLVVVLFFLLGAGIFAWTNIVGGSTNSTYYAPDLRGMTVEEATSYIRDTAEYRSHYVITVSEETISSSVYSSGTIAAQTPSAGTSTKQDMTQITVTICDNAEESASLLMPDLSGMNYEEAAQMLSDEYGVTASYTMESSEQYEKGVVISSSPVAGSELESGQTVRLYISSGITAASSDVTMIAVVGMTQEDAEAALTDIGLQIGTVTEVASYEDAGIVVGQSIEEGELISTGSSIALEVSKGYGTDTETEDEGESETEQTNSEDYSTLGDGSHYININMPSGRTEESYLVLTINGSELYSAYIGTDKTSVRLTVEGTIVTISITLDGESYTDYTIS